MSAIASLLALGATAYTNVNGGELQRCSGSGMALTGFTRNGHCVDQVRDCALVTDRADPERCCAAHYRTMTRARTTFAST
jgi:uncharacterized protein (DUF2237 family)